ncbi:MAG TPA: hypothetical protein VK141_02545 [Nitrosomonas sp.]|nr:hypothetical protein [Nitrosomonas sp.]
MTDKMKLDEKAQCMDERRAFLNLISASQLEFSSFKAFLNKKSIMPLQALV